MRKQLFLCMQMAILLLFLSVCVACNDEDEQVSGDVALDIKDFYPRKAEAGQILVITGSGMDKVTEVVFASDVAVSDFERIGLNQINVVIPAGVKEGAISLRSGQDVVTSLQELYLAQTAIATAYPEELKTGEVLIIKGQDLSCVKQIIFPNDVTVNAVDFVRKSETEIQVKVPRGTIDGIGMVKAVTASGKELEVAEIAITVVKEPEGGIVRVLLFDGTFDLGNWSGDLLISNELFVDVIAGASFTVEYEMKDTWGNLKVKRSSAQNSTFENSIPNGWGIDLAGGSSSFSFIVTQGDLEFIALQPGDKFALQGSNAIIKKVYVEFTKPTDILLWEGGFDLGNWSGDLTIPNDAFAQVSAGSTLMIEYEMKDTWGNLKVKRSDKQNSTFENSTPNGWGIDLAGGSTNYSFVVTQGDLDFIKAQPGDKLALQGSNAVIKKVLIIP